MTTPRGLCLVLLVLVAAVVGVLLIEEEVDDEETKCLLLLILLLLLLVLVLVLVLVRSCCSCVAGAMVAAPFRFVSPPLFSVLLLSSFFSFSFLPQITTNFYFVCDHTLKESREHKNLFTRGMRCSVIDHSIPRVSRRTHILLSPLREEDKAGN